MRISTGNLVPSVRRVGGPAQNDAKEWILRLPKSQRISHTPAIIPISRL